MSNYAILDDNSAQANTMILIKKSKLMVLIKRCKILPANYIKSAEG